MANFRDRVPENIPGKFYVDLQCIDCNLCVKAAPSIFHRIKARGWSAVYHQPVTEEEQRLAFKTLEACPTEAIGMDGDTNSWT
jgi:ferredoxin